MQEFEKILEAKYSYIEFCSQIMTECQLESIINLTSVEEISNMHKSLSEKLLNFHFSDNLKQIKKDN